MANIKNLEMAAAVAQYNNVSIKKAFFGLSQKIVYNPTQSEVDALINEYSPEDGTRLERLLAVPVESLAKEIEKKGKPTPTPIGNVRLEACLSRDHQFLALQLFRFVDFKYQPVTEPQFYEGNAAGVVAQLL